MSEATLGGRFRFPGTSSIAHLRENIAAGQLTLSRQNLAELDGIAPPGLRR